MKDTVTLFRDFFRYSWIVLLVIFFAGMACSSPPRIEKPLLPAIDLQGHRGARGLSPENTWPAFVQAYKYQMTTLELDTNLTQDDILIVHHDSSTNPDLCLDKDGKQIVSQPIRKLTSQYLLQLDCGTKKNENFPRQKPVPGTNLLTLADFFEKVHKYEKTHGISGANKPFFNVELKFPQNATEAHKQKAVQVIVQNIEQAKMVSRTTVQSFSPEVLPIVKKYNANIKTSALFSTGYMKGFMMYVMGFSMGRNGIIETAKKYGADTVSPHYSFVSASFVRQAHSKGVAVIPWTVNKEKEMKRLLNIGVDGIISDYPDVLRNVYNQWQK